MNFCRFLIVIIFITNYCSHGQVISSSFKLTKFEMCDQSTDYVWYLNSTIRNVNDKQYITGYAKFKTPFGENGGCNVTFYASAKGKRFVRLFNLHETETCQCTRMYLGEIFYDMERNSGAMYRSCPVSKGSYHLRNYKLNFNKMSLQSMPIGSIRLVINLNDRRTHRVLSCIIIEAEN